MVATLKPIKGLHNGCDERAAQEIESKLVELRMKLGEVGPILAWLEGALDEDVPFALLQRIHFNLNEAKADLPRLTCETRRELRGE